MTDKITKGTWIVNSYKHLLGIRQDAPELSHFEATDTAGKAGALLARLVTDESEVVSANKVKAFYRQSGIRRGELPVCLQHLKNLGKVDYRKNPLEEIPEVEVYCFSTQDALATTNDIYNALETTEYEEGSITSLEKTFALPHSDLELLEELTAEGLTEGAARTTLTLQETLGLVKVAKTPKLDRPIYYNEHAFTEGPEKIVVAMKSLSSSDKQSVEEIQSLVNENPGYPLEYIERQFPNHLLRMMEGVGLLDAKLVRSEHAEAVFLTAHQLKGIAIDVRPLSADVFHKAKLLLSSLRFGQFKSRSWRGRIDSPSMMLNITNKLLRGEWVGPCTAIGQDYTLLEIDGVIETRKFNSHMYEMKLRQREVGLMVKQMLLNKQVLLEADAEFGNLLTQEPLLSYEAPEFRRRKIIAKQTKPVKEIRDKMLETLRMGLRSTS
jgi:hypothetical protein